MSDSKRYGDETSFLQRWSQRKLQQRNRSHRPPESSQQTERGADVGAPKPASAQELPSIDDLGENSEVSMFLAEGVSEAIKRQALRKLFHLDKFNVVDGLDDYAEDYTSFQPLGNVMTAHQRLREEREKLRQLLAEDKQGTAGPEQAQVADAQPAHSGPEQQEPSEPSVTAQQSDGDPEKITQEG